jgi:hypothetical protein
MEKPGCERPHSSLGYLTPEEFATRADNQGECEQMNQAVTSVDSDKQNMEKFQKMFKSFSESQLDATKIMVSHAMCVSSDDPRLSGN